MKIFFLASLFLFFWVFCRQMKNHTRSIQEEQRSFWQKERAANSVRKKPLDNLDYISIPLDKLPMDSHTDDKTVADCISTLTILSERKIVNLTGITNTDLKLAYGTANITVLTEYDQNFTLLVTTLQKWAEVLYSLGDTESTKLLLEYAVSVGSDVSKTYSLLASIYEQNHELSQITSLKESAAKLTSSSGKIIVRKLEEAYPLTEKFE
ncbi:MAG: hypothetical protein IJX63_08365 [Lachnospiraceae bacterium]|nr:hypothetical protein [Lachnospiraceae bacterium]